MFLMSCRPAVAMLLALALSLLCGVAGARTELVLDAANQPVALQDWGDWWIDSGGKATPAQVASDAAIAWQPTRQNAIYKFTSSQALWVRFTVPPAPDAERWYVEVPYPSINRATLYTRDANGGWTGQSAGDTIAVSAWPVPHRYPLLPVAISASEPRSFLLRLENPNGSGAPLSFLSESHLGRSEQRLSLILGMYFGVAFLAVMVGALSAVSLRDAAYGLYAPTVALMALTQACLTGIAGLHLWPSSPRWNDLSSLILPMLTLVPMLPFISAVISLPERSLRFHRLMQGMAALGVVCSALIPVLDLPARVPLMVGYIVSAMLIGALAILWTWRRGDRYAGWVGLGALPVLLMTGFPMARAAGLIPQGFLTTHGMQFGIAIELPILLVVLMVRSQQRREHNRRIHGLDRIDPATGLINEQVFTERLQQMIARAVRLKHQGAVLLVDVTNIEQIQRDFGGRSAEELPLRVAGRLLSTAREIDSAARLSELRFGMLIEGPLTPEEAVATGPRVVARCLMPFKGKSPDWVAQLRVAQALVPLDGQDAAGLIARLDAVLASVPKENRRAVFQLGE